MSFSGFTTPILGGRRLQEGIVLRERVHCRGHGGEGRRELRLLAGELTVLLAAQRRRRREGLSNALKRKRFANGVAWSGYFGCVEGALRSAVELKL